MYEVDTKRLKSELKMYILCVVVLILFFIIMAFILKGYINKYKQLDSKTMSIGMDIRERESDDDITYAPDYYYNVNDTLYKCVSEESSSVYPSNKSVKVYYNSEDPGICATTYQEKSFYLALVAEIVLLIIFIKILIDLIGIIKSLNTIKRLQKNGKLLKNIWFTVSWKTYHFITVTFKLADGNPVTFTSKFIFYNKKFDDEQLIDILYDENNLKDYYIDFNINRIGGNLKSDYYMEDDDTIEED